MTGITLTRYVWLRRLHEAAKDLLLSDERVIDLAFRYQFSSQEPFTRAFAREAGCSPGKFRKNQMSCELLLPIEPSHYLLIQGGRKMKFEVKRLEAWKVMGVLYKGKNENQELQDAWKEVGQRANEIPHKRMNGNWYGVCEPLEESISDLDFEQAYEIRYVAGVEVTEVDQIPEGMDVWEIPRQEYAIFCHMGDVEKMGETYQLIYSKWLPESGYEAVHAHDFELYNEEFQPGKEDSKCYIYVPVKKIR
jgi:AraC family transcriptional regulator